MSDQKYIPRLVIVGRPNVGKSTLFNRLFGRRRALVHDFPGVTRDRLEEQAQWWIQARPYDIKLVDTGGLGGDRFAEEIKAQVGMALDVADVVIVLFDGQSGLTPADEEVVRELQRSGPCRRDNGKKIPMIGVVNKVDHENHETFLNDFFQTGLDPIITISAEHGRGIEDLRQVVRDTINMRPSDEVLEQPPVDTDDQAAMEAYVSDEEESEEPLSEEEQEQQLSVEDMPELEDEQPLRPDEERRIPRIAIIGKPNAGKSTLVNAILGENRMIVSPIAGTTIDAVDSPATIDGLEVVLIDTAGIRRKSKTEQGVEVLSVVQARKALERCDVAVLVIDGDEGVTDQDEKIGGMIEEIGCGVILAINKWDLLQHRKGTTKETFAEQVRGQMAYLRYAPLMFMSAKKNQGIDNLGHLVDEINDQRRVKIATHELTEWVRRESEVHNPGNAKFYMTHQAGKNPPTFVAHVSNPEKVHFSLRRHLVNAMRARWGFMGSPVRILFLKGKSRKGPASRPKQHGPRQAPRPAANR